MAQQSTGALVAQPNGSPNRKVLAAWLASILIKLWNDAATSGCEAGFSPMCSLPELPLEVALLIVGAVAYQAKEWSGREP